MTGRKTYLLVLTLAGLLLASAQVWGLTDVSANAAYSALSSDPNAILIDVRTTGEYLAGTPTWTDPNGVTRYPINLQFWNTLSPADWYNPTNPTDLKAAIEALLATGEIDFNTPIYLLCKTAWRSHYMGLWLEGNLLDSAGNIVGSHTFYNAATGTSGVFTNVYDIDADGTPSGGQGGWVEWTGAGLPTAVPGQPQVIAYGPADGTTSSTSDVTFTALVFDPVDSGGVSIADESSVEVVVGGTPTALSYAGDYYTGSEIVIRQYSGTVTLADGSYDWTVRATNSVGTAYPFPVSLGTASTTRLLTVTTPPPADTTPPTVAIDSPVDGQTYTSLPIPVQVTATDDTTPADQLTVSADLNGNPVALTYDAATGQWVGSIDGITDGTYTLSVSVTDGAGNSASASATFTYQAPTPAAEFPAGAAIPVLVSAGGYLLARRRLKK